MTAFTIEVGDEQLDDLRSRLRNTRWTDAVHHGDWKDGADLAFLQRLIAYWHEGFDWRAQERRLNELPQYTTRLGGLDVHVIHRRGAGPAPFPLLLTHGWPGHGFDMAKIIPMLTDPAAYGGDPADAFDVVAPSIPGHGFSQRPDRPGFGPERVAGMWSGLMADLGYDRYGAHGTDWGAAVSMWLALQRPDQLSGLHVNFIPGSFTPPLGEGRPPVTEQEASFVDAARTWFDTEGAYHRLHSTKPQTPAYGLVDSPVGLAAWITEKMRGWSDCDGDVERVFSLDDILTNVSIYWHTATIGSSMRFYYENRLRPSDFATVGRAVPPLGVSAFPADLTPPRSWVERVFTVTRWTEMPRGGHFGDLEDPDGVAREIREFFRPLRTDPAPRRRR